MSENIEDVFRLLSCEKGKDRKFVEIKEAVNTITEYATEFGLSEDQVFGISNLVASGLHAGNNAYSLIHYLIPVNTVSENTFLNILSKVLSNRCANRIKAKLINWIVAVFDLSISTDRLHCLYNQLFMLLRYEVLCGPVCKLLVLLTRKEDVTAFQVNRLLKIQDEIGNQSSLAMLFTVFKKFNPSLVTISSRRSKVKVSSPSEILWREMLLKFNISSKNSLNIMLQQQINMVANKEIGAVNDERKSFSSFKSLEDVIRYVSHLTYLDSECTSEVCLTEGFLLSLLTIDNDVSLQIRLSCWLRSELSVRDIISNDKKSAWLLKTLVKLTDLTNNFQGITFDYLSQYLPFWNGRNHIGSVLMLISQLPLVEYEDLLGTVLSVLWKLTSISPSPSYSTMIIGVLRRLASNYINFEIPRYLLLPVDLKHSIDWTKTLKNLMDFVNRLISMSFLKHWNNAQIKIAALRYYDTVSKDLKSQELDLNVIPPAVVVFNCLLSCSSTILSMVCDVVFQSVNKFKQLATLNKLHEVDQEHGALLNIYITEIFNTLWRHRAFDDDSQSLYRSLNGEVLEKHYDLCVPVSTVFSLEHHPALVLTNAYYALEMNLTEEELYQGEYVTKEGYFKHLKAHGCSGITDLITLIRRPHEHSVENPSSPSTST